jgi:hypothetical protein
MQASILFFEHRGAGSLIAATHEFVGAQPRTSRPVT